MSSADVFNLGKAKILPFGKGLTHSRTITPYDVSGKEAFSKHCGERTKWR